MQACVIRKAILGLLILCGGSLALASASVAQEQSTDSHKQTVLLAYAGLNCAGTYDEARKTILGSTAAKNSELERHAKAANDIGVKLATQEKLSAADQRQITEEGRSAIRTSSDPAKEVTACDDLMPSVAATLGMPF